MQTHRAKTAGSRQVQSHLCEELRYPSESRLLNRENRDSGEVKITDQEPLKSRSNNTEYNNTDIRVKSIFVCKLPSGISRIKRPA